MSKELEALKTIKRLVINKHGYGDDYKPEIELLEKALLRNEPMKPLIEIEDEYCEYFLLTAKCKCGEVLFHNKDSRNLPVLGLNYCPHCGQKLDWSLDK